MIKNISGAFKQAHAMTRKIIKTGDSYRVVFGKCLKIVLESRAGKTVISINKWVKKGVRFYLNIDSVKDAGYIEEANGEFVFDNVKNAYKERVIKAINAINTVVGILYEDDFTSLSNIAI